MHADDFNKSIYHRLTTAELKDSLKVYKLWLKVISSIEKMNGIFTSGTNCCTLFTASYLLSRGYLFKLTSLDKMCLFGTPRNIKHRLSHASMCIYIRYLL